MLTAVLAGIATTLVVASYIPQIVRGYRTKSLEDVSMWFLVIIFLGILVWIAYGIIVRDWIFTVSNIVLSTLSGTLIAMKLRYDHR